MAAKLTQEEVEKRISYVQENQYIMLETYINKSTSILIKCQYCGLEWRCLPSILFRNRIGKGCKHHVNLNFEMAKKRIEKESQSKITLVGKYKGAKVSTTMQCVKCSYKWNTEPYIVYAVGVDCPKCAHRIKRTSKDFQKEIFKLVGDEYSVLSAYVKSHSKVVFRHETCGNVFEMTPHAFLGGQRCTNSLEVKVRRNDSQIMPLEVAQNILKKNRNEEYVIIGD